MGSGEGLAMQVLSPFGSSRLHRHPEWTSLFEDPAKDRDAAILTQVPWNWEYGMIR